MQSAFDQILEDTMGDTRSDLLAMMKDPSLLVDRAYLAGEWVDGDGEFEVTNPARGDVITKVADCSRAQVAEAIAAAEASQKAWAAMTAKERSVILRR